MEIHASHRDSSSCEEHHHQHCDDDDPEEHTEDAPEEDGAGGALLELPAVGVDDEGHHETDESQDQSQQERYQADVGDGPGAAGGLGGVDGATAVGGGCSGEPGPAAGAEGIGVAIQIGYCCYKKQLSLKSILGSAINYLTASTIMFLSIMVVKGFIGTGLKDLCLIVTVGILVYFIVLIILRDSLVISTLKSVILFLKRRDDQS